MKKVYVLKVTYEYIGVYETKEKAMIEGLSRYTNWLKEYTNACGYSDKEIVADLQSLISQGYIEDYIYIYEVPYFEG